MDLDKGRLSKGVAALEALRDEAPLPDHHNSKLPKRRVDIITNDAIDPRWLDSCMVDDRARPLSNLANVMLALRRDPALASMVAYDEMLCAAMLLHPVPVFGEPLPQLFGSRPVTDADVGALQEYLQLSGLPKVAKDTVHQAVDLRAPRGPSSTIK